MHEEWDDDNVKHKYMVTIINRKCQIVIRDLLIQILHAEDMRHYKIENYHNDTVAIHSSYIIHTNENEIEKWPETNKKPKCESPGKKNKGRELFVEEQGSWT